MADILEKICMQRKIDVEKRKKEVSVDELKRRIAENNLHASVVDFPTRISHARMHACNDDDDDDDADDDVFVRTAVLAEIKRASPSKGDICVDMVAGEQAKRYAHAGACCISVLTEPTWFKGTIDDLLQARMAINEKLSRPAILRKDFIIDEFQIYEARAYGADSLLLIVKCLNDDELTRFLALSRSLQMEPLVEVQNEEEMKRAVAVGAKVIGVNNRNLRDFSVDLDTTTRLAKSVSNNIILIALSGISTAKDAIDYENNGIHAVLVGEALMRSEDPIKLIKELSGEDRSSLSINDNSDNNKRIKMLDSDGSGNRAPLVKICGIMDELTAALCRDVKGIDFVGFVFAKNSKRYVSIDNAVKFSNILRQNNNNDNNINRYHPPNISTNTTSKMWYISHANMLQTEILERRRRRRGKPNKSHQHSPFIVGVFADQPREEVEYIAERVQLDIIQLSGLESIEYCQYFAKKNWAVMKAIHVSDPNLSENVFALPGYYHFILLDTKSSKDSSARGGTGETFDWEIAKRINDYPFFLAGGLSYQNVNECVKLAHPWAIDVSSGVETNGIKDHEKIRKFVNEATTHI